MRTDLKISYIVNKKSFVVVCYRLSVACEQSLVTSIMVPIPWYNIVGTILLHTK